MATSPVNPLMPVTFNYTPIADLTTCQPYTFQWTYTATNMSVNNTLFSFLQYGDFSHIPGRDDGYLFQSIPIATQSSWTWPKVDVAAGQYALISWIEGNSTIKPSPQSFTVTNGSDTSCVVSPAEAAVQATPSPTSGTNSATGSSSTSSSHHISTGAIVGIALGILSGVAIIVLLSRLLKKRRQTSSGRAAAFVARQQSLRHASRDSAVGLVGLRGSNADWFTPPFAQDKGDGSSQYSRDSAFMNYGYEKDLKPAGNDAFSLPYGVPHPAPPMLPYGAAPPTLPYGATPSVPPRAMSRVPVQYGDGDIEAARRESEEGGERQSRNSATYHLTPDVQAPRGD